MKNPARKRFRPEQLTAAALARALRVTESRRWRMPPNPAATRMLRRDWVIERFMSGSLDVQVDGAGWHRFAPGDAVLYAPGARCSEQLASRQCTSVFLRFHGPGKALRTLLKLRGNFVRFDDRSNLLAPHLDRCCDGINGGLAAGLDALGCAHQAIALVLRAPADAAVRPIAAPTPATRDLVTAVHHHLREHLAERVRLEGVAARVNLSASGLSHAYRRLTGRSPMAALRGFRIEAARVMLTRGGMKLSAIAARTGFADAFHLSRTFRQLTGQSPRQFLTTQG